MSEKLEEALHGQLGMMQTVLTHAIVGRARVLTPLGQDCEVETQQCPLHLTIESR